MLTFSCRLRPTLLDHQLIQTQLLCCMLQRPLLDVSLCDKSEQDFLSSPTMIGAIHGFVEQLEDS